MRKTDGHKVWLGPAFFVFSFLVVLGAVLVVDYRRAFGEAQNTLSQELADVRTILTYRLEYDRHFLLMLSEQMSDGYLTEPIFLKNVKRYVSNRIYLIDVTWSGPDGVVQWKSSDKFIPKNMQRFLERNPARETRKIAYSRPYQDRGGDFLFDVYVPVFKKENFLGMFTGVYSSRNLLKFVHSRKHLADQYLIRMVDSNGKILAQCFPSVPLDARLAKQSVLDPPGQGVLLGLEGRKIGISNWQGVMLVLGCAVIALGMGWSMWMMKREIIRRKRVEESLILDMTERRKAEEQLQKSRNELAHAWRVATVGEMAGSLAHELNQPLCSIATCADTCTDILKTKGLSTPEILPALEEIASQAQRAGYIIRHIKEFVRKSEPKRSSTDLNEILRRVLKLVEPEINRRGIVLETHFADHLPVIQADAVQIEQVILNLVQNAMDAVNEIKADNRKILVQADLEPENKVKVLVKDTGPGLSPEVRTRLFEPFFTTKPEGLGMGLSISRSIIENHGGKLQGFSDPGRGATFQFTLSTLTDK